MFHPQRLQDGSIDERQDVRLADLLRQMRSKQNRHARVLVLRPGGEL